jgi:hypothetical protein
MGDYLITSSLNRLYRKRKFGVRGFLPELNKNNAFNAECHDLHESFGKVNLAQVNTHFTPKLSKASLKPPMPANKSINVFISYFVVIQFEPTPTSAITGTSNSTAFSISRLTNAETSSISFFGTSSNSSS